LTTDVVSIIYVFLSIFTTCIMFLYYRRVREGYKEYSKAKAVLDDVILSFGSDLRRLQHKIVEISNESEKSSVGNLQMFEDLNSRIVNIKTQLDDLAKAQESLLSNHEGLKRSVGSIVSQRDMIVQKIAELESLWKERQTPEVRVQSPIAIRREGVLAPLTETELKVLELLAVEGGKTAPEVKDRINLTREHTARLMKSLYARGYVDREVDKMPYVYRLNKEMVDLMRQQKKASDF